MTTLSTGARNHRLRPDPEALLLRSLVYPGTNDDDAKKKIAAKQRARIGIARVSAFIHFAPASVGSTTGERTYLSKCLE
jgi:hypothetical protein